MRFLEVRDDLIDRGLGRPFRSRPVGERNDNLAVGRQGVDGKSGQ